MPRTVLLLIVLFLAGCSAPSATPESIKTLTPSSTPLAFAGAWTITMTHSGGIMGLSRSIEVSSDGKFTVVDARANKTITGKLAVDELSKISEQVISAEYIPEEKPGGMGCADCFIYDLEIQRNGDRFAMQLNDISLPNSGLEPLVNYLRGLMDTALN